MNKNIPIICFCFFLLVFQNANAQTPADAEVATFASPVNTSFCPTQLPISINIYNNDLVDITEVVLNWSINSVAQSPVTFSGLIAAGDIAPVELNPSFDFMSGTSYFIEVTIQTVNTLQDPNPANDTNSFTFDAHYVPVPSFYWNGCAFECLDSTNYLSLQWFKDGSPDPNAPHIPSLSYTPAQSGNYSMIGLTYDSCDAPADTTIFANPPAHGIAALGLTTFCEGDSVGLVFSASVQVFYTWNTGSASDTIYAAADGWYSVNGVTSNSCPINDSILVTVHPLPVVMIATNGTQDTLYSNYSGLHQWYYNGGMIGGAHDSTYIPTQAGIYYCTATDVYGCVGTSNSINWIMPGISIPIETTDLMLYPNPAIDVLNIKFNTPQEKLVLRIFDSLGRIVLEEVISGDKAINISSLNIGVYQCVFSGNQKTFSQKLVKTF